MPVFKLKLTVLVGVVLATCAGIAYYVVLPRVNAPPPNPHNWAIAPGGVARAIVQEKKNPARNRGRRGGLRPSYLPHHIDFEATGGAAVYLVPYPTGGSRKAVEEMTRLTDQLRAGQPPAHAVAQGSGTRGRISINWRPYGQAKYLVLVRCEQQSEVSLLVHYGP
jgi:hypothetical protein